MWFNQHFFFRGGILFWSLGGAVGAQNRSRKMDPRGAQPINSRLRSRESLLPQNDLQEQMKEALREVYDLLELYGPIWYSQSLHDKLETILKHLT